MNVPVEPDGTLGIVDGISAPGLSRRPARRDGRARRDLELPADQQPVQRLRPHAGPPRGHRDACPSEARDGVKKVLVANRGEIACRIIRTLDRLGIESVAVYSDADRAAPHVGMADQAVRIGPVPPRRELPRRRSVLLDAARGTGADARPPRATGSSPSTPSSPTRSRRAGLAFIGPTPEQIRRFGAKDSARDAGRGRRRPAAPGLRGRRRRRAMRSDARRRVGFPLMVKSVAGGGGIGMRVCRDARRAAGDRRARPCARASRPSGRRAVFLERLVARARHVEVQVFGDGDGRGRRARRPRLLAAAPPPEGGGGDAGAEPRRRAARRRCSTRRAACSSRCGTARRARSSSWSTPSRETFAFLEVNTRLQVEHPVTEAVTGVDLVEWMVRLAAGDAGVLDAATRTRRAATHRGAGLRRGPGARLPAERRPRSPTCTGRRARASTRGCAPAPRSARTTTRCSPRWSCTRPDRADARRRVARRARRDASTASRPTCDLLRSFVASAGVRRRRGRHRQRSAAHRVRAAHDRGARRRAASRPCRTIPAGSALARRRAAERADGRPVVPARQRDPRQPADAAGLECTATGPTLRVRRATRRLPHRRATIDATPRRRAGAVVDAVRRARRRELRLGRGRRPRACAPTCSSAAASTCPTYLGSARRRSRSAGSAATAAARCAAGDVLHLARRTIVGRADRAVARPASAPALTTAGSSAWSTARTARPSSSPTTTSRRSTRPSGRCTTTRRAPACGWSARSPEWARADGGEAGLHPSNIHDTPYTVGAVDFTGDMPIILGPDGPSLGGFVCPVTVISRRAVEARPARARRHRPLRPRVAMPRRRAAGGMARAAWLAPRTEHAAGVLAVRAGRRRRAAGHVPAERRRAPARGVRADGARPRPAAPRPRARGVGRRRRGRRRRRRHARHPVAAGARRRRHADGRRRCSTLLRAAEDELPALDDVVVAEPHRAPAAVVGRPRDPRGDRALHALGARRRAVVPVEHRVHPPHQRARRRSTTSAASCSTPSTSCSGSATCTSARRSRCRSTRATGSSPRSTTRRARGRRRTRSASAARTCASTAWRAPAATSSSAARCRCGAGTARARSSTGDAVAAALLRPDPVVSRSRPTSCSTCAPRRAPGGSTLDIDDGAFRRADHRAFLERDAAAIAAFRRRRAGRVRRRARALGGERRVRASRRRSSSPA